MLSTVFTCGGQDIPLKYKSNPRAKRLSLRMSLKEVSLVLTLPPKVTDSQVKNFLHQCTPWVEKQAKKLLKSVTIKPGEVVSLHGISFECVTDPLRRKPALCKTTQTLFLPPRCEQNDLYVQFKKMAEEILEPYVLTTASALGQRVEAVKFRDMKSRWGSCSAKKSISLNWRLILAPPEVAQYVCVHEAAHLLHMNHGQAFWKVVADFCPLFKSHRKWLKTYGSSLLRV